MDNANDNTSKKVYLDGQEVSEAEVLRRQADPNIRIIQESVGQYRTLKRLTE